MTAVLQRPHVAPPVGEELTMTVERLPSDVAGPIALATNADAVITRLEDALTGLSPGGASEPLAGVLVELRRARAARLLLAQLPADTLRREFQLRQSRLWGRS